MVNTFAFVDNFAIDGRSRKEIRSHVMRGKNTSKARAKGQRCVPIQERPEPEARTEEPKEPQMLEMILHNTNGWLTATSTMEQAPITLPDDFSGVSFPVAMNKRSRLLIKQFYLSYGRYMYPPEFCLPLSAIETPWFKYILEDEAYFYGTLAISTACWDIARGKKRLSPEYKAYFSKTLSLLNAKLSKPEQAKDTSTVALIVGLCILASTLGDFASLRVHIEGLRMVVQLRGGIHTLHETPVVMEKVQRADIEDALSNGSTPVFASQTIAERLSALPSLSAAEFPSLESIRAIHPGLATAAQEIHLLTRYLGSVADGKRLKPNDYHGHVTYTFSLLLALGPVGAAVFCDPVADLVHLTLAAMMSVLTVQFGIPNGNRYDLLNRRLTWAVDSIMATSPTLETVIDPYLMNWILHVLPASVMREDANPWLLPKLVFLRETIGFDTWNEAHIAAQEYPWVPGFHDKHILKLWQASILEEDTSESDTWTSSSQITP